MLRSLPQEVPPRGPAQEVPPREPPRGPAQEVPPRVPVLGPLQLPKKLALQRRAWPPRKSLPAALPRNVSPRLVQRIWLMDAPVRHTLLVHWLGCCWQPAVLRTASLSHCSMSLRSSQTPRWAHWPCQEAHSQWFCRRLSECSRGQPSGNLGGRCPSQGRCPRYSSPDDSPQRPRTAAPAQTRCPRCGVVDLQVQDDRMWIQSLNPMVWREN